MYGPYLMPVETTFAVLSEVPASLEYWVMWFQKSAVTAGGSLSWCCSRYRAIWLRSVWAVVCTFDRRASLLAELNCGMTIAARMPRMITTIRISIRVKPDLRARLLRIAFIVNAPVVAPGPLSRHAGPTFQLPLPSLFTHTRSEAHVLHGPARSWATPRPVRPRRDERRRPFLSRRLAGHSPAAPPSASSHPSPLSGPNRASVSRPTCVGRTSTSCLS